MKVLDSKVYEVKDINSDGVWLVNVKFPQSNERVIINTVALDSDGIRAFVDVANNGVARVRVNKEKEDVFQSKFTSLCKVLFEKGCERLETDNSVYFTVKVC